MKVWLKVYFLLIEFKLQPELKFGLDHENEATESYVSLTGNNVFKTGFVINPSSCLLGTSPDREVVDPNSVPMHGHLEIRCPNSDSITNLKYLDLINNTYKLKTTHEYYHQIMGQMGITGLLYCILQYSMEHKNEVNNSNLLFF